MSMIDLRSDTVTLPTPVMRAAMAAAEVGDDVFGEDPTVRRLEQMAARRVGHEAALFVPSGTMDLEAMADAVRSDNVHYPRSRLICLENTHNQCGGRVLTPAYTTQVVDLGQEAPPGHALWDRGRGHRPGPGRNT